MRRSDFERRIITDPGGVSGGTFDLLALILTLMNRQKQRSSPRVSFFDRVLTDQREKSVADAVEWQHDFLREKVLWMMLNGSMYLERCFS